MRAVRIQFNCQSEASALVSPEACFANGSTQIPEATKRCLMSNCA